MHELSQRSWTTGVKGWCPLLAGSRHWSVTVNKVNSCLRASADAGGLGGEAGIAHIVLCDPTSIEKHSLQDE